MLGEQRKPTRQKMEKHDIYRVKLENIGSDDWDYRIKFVEYDCHAERLVV